jgi:hypothetical protein
VSNRLLVSSAGVYVLQKGTVIKKGKRLCQEVAGNLFFLSTDPVAKERLFLERFTCFQQG